MTQFEPADLQQYAREAAAAADRRHAETLRLQEAADVASLTFGAPRHTRKLKPARNLDLFSPEAQPRLF